MSNSSKKKLLILGGIALSKEIIESAKRQGAIVYVTDYLEDSPSKNYADKSFMISTVNIDALVELVKQESIDGILTGYIDLLLPFYQQLCEKTGKYCYATAKQIELFTDKMKFKNLCKKFNIPVVEEYFINNPFDIRQLNNFNYPVLLKPADNSGGRGITICRDASTFESNYQKSMSFSPSKNVLIERYIEAEEVTIFYLIDDGNITLTAMGDRFVKHIQDNIIPLPIGYFFPSKYLDIYKKQLHNKVVEMFKSIGLKNGMLFIQSFVVNGECIFYEIGYRLTGSLEYKLINHSCGLNPLDMMVNFSLTGNMGLNNQKTRFNPDFNNKVYSNMSFLIKPGIIGKINGTKEIEKLDNVIDIVLSYKKGDEIPLNALGTLAQVVARVFVWADTKSQLANIMQTIKQQISVVDQNGENMLISDFDYNTILI